MIDFEIDPDLPVPYCAVRIDGRLHVLENPRIYATMPHWLRQMHLNDTLREAQGPTNPPRRRAEPKQQQIARVIDLDAYREIRTGT